MVCNKHFYKVRFHTKEEALEADYTYFYWYLADELYGDREVMIKAIQQYADTFEYATEDLKNDRAFVLKVMQVDLDVAKRYANEGLWNDRAFVLQAVEQDGMSLQFADVRLRADRDLVMKAVEQDGISLQFADVRLQADRDLVMKAVGVCGLALEYASDSLKCDCEIVLKAVEQNVESFKFANSYFRADREFVIKAVCKDPRALEFVANELRHDFNFMVEACAAEPRSLDYVKEDLKERIREESEAITHIRDDLKANAKELDKECRFFFVTRETFLEQRTWPRYKDMEKALLLVEESIRLADGVRGKYSKYIVSISHCWERPDMPDPTGKQLQAIKDYLVANPDIRLVWGDFSSMPQGDRTPRDKMEFKRMLPRINLLYLTTSVLQIVDITYPSRFWTQFEAWLAMQRCTKTGIRGANAAGEVRYKIICIHSAQQAYEGAKLIITWQNATAKTAFDVLSADDVRVTNLSDKEAQLPKIKILDEAVIEAFKEDSELPDPVQEEDQEVEEMPAKAELTGDHKTELDQLKEKNELLEKETEQLKEEIEALKKAELTGDHKTELKHLKEENTVLKKDIEILRLRNENTMLRASATGGNALHAVHTAKNEADNYTPAVGDNVLIRPPQDEQARIDCANEKLSLRLLKQHTNELLQICTLAWMMESVKGRLQRKKEQLAKELDDDLKASTVAM